MNYLKGTIEAVKVVKSNLKTGSLVLVKENKTFGLCSVKSDEKELAVKNKRVKVDGYMGGEYVQDVLVKGSDLNHLVLKGEDGQVYPLKFSQYQPVLDRGTIGIEVLFEKLLVVPQVTDEPAFFGRILTDRDKATRGIN